MGRMIKRFIVWYLKRHNVTFEYNNYVVRMFSKGYYDELMHYADIMRGVNCRHYSTPIFTQDMRKEDEGK